MSDGHYRIGRVRPAGQSMDAFIQDCVEKRRAYAAGETVPEQPKLRSKTNENEGPVLTMSDDEND